MSLTGSGVTDPTLFLVLNHHPDEWTHIEPGEVAGGNAKLWAARPPLYDGHRQSRIWEGGNGAAVELLQGLRVVLLAEAGGGGD